MQYLYAIMLIGYARVSTGEQTTAAQVAALKTSGCELIFRDHASGGRWDRPELHKLLSQLRKGDVVVVWTLDRLSCRRPRESEEVWTRIVASVRSLNSSGFLINTKRMDCGRLCETALRVVLQAGVGASCASTPAAASIAPAVVLPRCFG